MGRFLRKTARLPGQCDPSVLFPYTQGFVIMKKDAVYSMRMTIKVRDALKQAAEKDCRSVASLLDKIITDYLSEEGFLKAPEFDTESRRFHRKKVTLPAKTFLKEESKYKLFPCVVLNISESGVLVTYPKGTEIRFASEDKIHHFGLCLEHPKMKEEINFDCKTSHMRYTEDEIQVGAAFRNPKERDLQKLQRYLV